MTLAFRPLEKADFARFAQWLGEPHVARWWQEPATVEFVAREYGACTDGDFRTRVYVVEADGQPIGIAQVYRVEEYPEHAEEVRMPGGVGIDYLIGEPKFVDRGYGTRMVSEFIEQVVRPLYPDAIGVVADPEVVNEASVRVLTKAGFERGEVVPGEHGPEVIMRLRF